MKTTNANIFLSVIVPVYNIKDYLPKCVDSILAQGLSQIELFLVDDGSTDGSGELCDVLALSDSRIIVVHKPNGGVNSARNLGLCRAQGKYILFVDGDDYIKPNTFSCAQELLQNNPNIDLLQFPEVYVENGQEKIRDGYPHTFITLSDKHEIMLSFLEMVPPPSKISGLLCGKFYAARVWQGLHLREDMQLNEDYYVMPDIIERCRSIASMTQGGYCYLMRKGSASHSEYTPKKRLDVYRTKTKLYKIAKKYNISHGAWWNEAVFAAIDAWAFWRDEKEIKETLKMLKITKPNPDRIPPFPKRAIKLARWFSPFIAAEINRIYIRFRRSTAKTSSS